MDRNGKVQLLNPSIDRDIRRFVEEVTAAWAEHGDLSSVTPAEARKIAEEVRGPWRKGGPRIAKVTERLVPTSENSVRVRFYDPDPRSEEKKPALIYLHGGGWTLFSLDTHDRVMREYASRAGVVVVGVDYALAPEAKYPVALNQIVWVARWLAKEFSSIAIGGDSAGANLALAAALRLRDEPIIRGLVLNYGVFARTSSAEAVARFGGPGNMLTADEMEGLWRGYLRDERDAKDPLVVPMLADLSELPPTLLIVPEIDLLTEQSYALAERLLAAGVRVEFQLYRGAVHSFLEAVSISSIASRAFDDTASWLRATLA